jgi:DNA modification methylase
MSSRILTGDCRAVLTTLPDESVHCCVTSPPYMGLRDYGVDGQMGLEATLDAYLAGMVDVFREVRRVLRKDGTCWIAIGDSYASAWPCNRRNLLGNGSLANGKRENRPPRLPDGLKEKDLMMVPARLAIALQADGWWLRSDIIWHKKAPMPESATDRPTQAHEHIFLLTKAAKYWYDHEAVKEKPALYQRKGGTAAWTAESGHTNGVGSSTFHQMSTTGANLRNVWTLGPDPYPGARFATFPKALAETCIKAGCPAGGTVLDPFLGSGTTLLVADRLGRDGIGIELNPEYAEQARARITNDAPMFTNVVMA